MYFGLVKENNKWIVVPFRFIRENGARLYDKGSEPYSTFQRLVNERWGHNVKREGVYGRHDYAVSRCYELTANQYE